MRVLLVLLACASALLASGPAPQSPKQGHILSVSIRTEKLRFHAGDGLRIHVLFRNDGPSPIRVGRLVSTNASSPFRLAITLKDSEGHAVLDPEPDLQETPCMDLREPDPQHPFVWTELAPAATYSTNVDVRIPWSTVPGRYKLQAQYRSYGLQQGGHCMGVQPNGAHWSESATDSAIHKEWAGQLQTNPIWITVSSLIDPKPSSPPKSGH